MPKTAAVDSRSHPAVQRCRAARDGKDPRSVFAEGARLVAELLKAGARPREFLFSSDKPEVARLTGDLARRGAAGVRLSAKAMAFASGLDAPPGLIVRADRPEIPDLAGHPALTQPAPLIVVLNGLQSPANVGAVLRVAEAAGADAVAVAPGTADPLGPKALRASAGSAFRVPLAAAPSENELLALLAEKKIPRVAADARGARAHWDWPWARGAALWLGPERGFDSPPEGDSVRIPMAGRVESLNVAVAAGVILMEAARQRGKA